MIDYVKLGSYLTKEGICLCIPGSDQNLYSCSVEFIRKVKFRDFVEYLGSWYVEEIDFTPSGWINFKEELGNSIRCRNNQRLIKYGKI